MPRKRQDEKQAQQTPAAPRGMWTGTISFGLVSVPVELFPAMHKRPVQLRMLAEDGTPLQRQYVCPKHNKPLESGDFVRGYEDADGRMIPIQEQELEALAPEKTRDISLSEFVDVKTIDRFCFDRLYFLAPAGGSSKAYRLLAHVMEEESRAGIARLVMRGKEYLIAITARRGLLMAETLRFADELRHPADVDLSPPAQVDERQVEQFSRAITSLTRRTLDQRALADSYALRFQQLIQKKRKIRKAVVRPATDEQREESSTVDLVALFRQRLREAEKRAA